MYIVMSNLSIFILNFINFITPKSKRISVFISFPDYDDSIRELLRQENNLLNVVLVSRKLDIDISNMIGIRFIKRKSIMGFYYLIRSKKIFFTHGVFKGFIPLSEERQVAINIWHGMPIKKIGVLDNKNPVKFHRTIATSIFFKEIIMKCFDVNEDKVVISNIPRNNVLLNVDGNIENVIGEDYIVWMPTYKKSNVGEIRVDTSIANYNKLAEELLKDYDFKRKLIIKPHPMDSIDFSAFLDMADVILISDEWLLNSGLTLYELLSKSSALVTDFSSVCIDYLITGKPIYYYSIDYSEYESSRGFCFDYSLLPGSYIVHESQFAKIMTDVEVICNYSHEDALKFNNLIAFNIKDVL